VLIPVGGRRLHRRLIDDSVGLRWATCIDHLQDGERATGLRGFATGDS